MKNDEKRSKAATFLISAIRVIEGSLIFLALESFQAAFGCRPPLLALSLLVLLPLMSASSAFPLTLPKPRCQLHGIGEGQNEIGLKVLKQNAVQNAVQKE